MLDHLVSATEADFVPDILPGDAAFDPLEDLTPSKTLNAQYKTSKWLESFADDDEEAMTQAQQEKVAHTFNSLVTNDPRTKQKLLQLDLPDEIKSAIGMVTAYQWKFVEPASYTHLTLPTICSV